MAKKARPSRATPAGARGKIQPNKHREIQLVRPGRPKLFNRAAQLAGLTIDGRYEGPGRSPDRADAMVWAMSALLRAPATPRIRFL